MPTTCTIIRRWLSANVAANYPLMFTILAVLLFINAALWLDVLWGR